MKRVTTGLALAVVLIALWVVQGPLLRIAFGCIAFAAVGEMVRALKAGGKRPVVWPSMLYAALTMPVYLLQGRAALYALLMLFIVLGCTAVVLRGKPDLDALGATILPMFYPGALFALIYPLQDIADPYLSTLAMGLALMSALLCDVFAWLVGRTVGKRPLCPELSPKKTVEGALGGLIGGAISAPISVLITRIIMAVTGRGAFDGGSLPPMLALIAVATVAGALSQAGDLTASLIKRQLNIKDYGNFLPGHGGIMDRIDSVLFSILIVYLYFIFFLRAVIV